MNGARLEELLLQAYPADDLLLCVPQWDSPFQRGRCSPRDHPLSLSAALCPQFQPPGVSAGSGFRTYPHLYKTELCRRFAESGGCKYGDRCQFAHGLHELRLLPRHPKYKTEYCRTFHTLGFCPYESRCHFIHEEGERRSPPRLDPPPSLARRTHCAQLGGGVVSWHSAPPGRARSPASDGVSSSASETPERCPGSPSPTPPSSRCFSFAGRGIAELLELKLRALERSETLSPTGSSLSSERQSPLAPDCPPDPRSPGGVGGHRPEPLSSSDAAKRLPVFSWISTRNT